MNITGHYTRFFNMSYDSLVNRSRSDRAFRVWFTGDSTNKPLVQSFHLLTGLTEPFRAKESGSFGSRLPEYLEKSHHGVDMPAADKRIVYEWLDAMIPYYPTCQSILRSRTTASTCRRRTSGSSTSGSTR